MSKNVVAGDEKKESMRIVFSEPDISQNVIYISNLDGSNKISFDFGDYFTARIKGDNIWVISYPSDKKSIFWRGNREGKFVKFGSLPFVGITVISPDGSSVAYLKEIVRGSREQFQLWLTRFADGKSILLRDNLEDFRFNESLTHIGPESFSLDGKKIYLTYQQDAPVQSHDGYGDSIFEFDIETKKIKKINLVTGGWINFLTFSPNFDKLAFTADVQDEGWPRSESIYLSDLTNGETKEVFYDKELRSYSEPLWSPNQGKILLKATKGSWSERLVYIDLSDNSLHQIVQFIPNVRESFWESYWIGNDSVLFSTGAPKKESVGYSYQLIRSDLVTKEEQVLSEKDTSLDIKGVLFSQ